MKKTIYGLMVVAALSIQMQAAHATALQDTNTSAPQSVSMSQKINLNTASQLELESLPGVGASKAKAIIAYRENIGEFLEVEQLTEVRGIGEKMLNKIKAYVVVAH
ncbi:ComEA family DNA-binding protein [Alteromonas sp. A079]|uniref:ComEA family DNA-binding protein n=1 Tax=Alteromonas sp. A079 TaxID=3410268 RepID=UPI003BA34B83